jgi:hypothetical protein
MQQQTQWAAIASHCLLRFRLAAGCCAEAPLLRVFAATFNHVPPCRHGKKSVKCKESPRPTITDPVSTEWHSLHMPQSCVGTPWPWHHAGTPGWLYAAK